MTAATTRTPTRGEHRESDAERAAATSAAGGASDPRVSRSAPEALNGGVRLREAASGVDSEAESVARLAESRLFSRAAQGERAAIDEVWRANRRWLAGVVATHAPRGADIEDILQEVAATFVAKAREVRDALSLRGWLRMVAVNASRMEARGRAVERRSMSVVAGEAMRARRDAAGSAHASRETLEAAAEAEETLALLRELPALYAEPLLLQAGKGLSQRAIAELLGVPETTVETRLARARRMLRESIVRRERGGPRDVRDGCRPKDRRCIAGEAAAEARMMP